MCSGGIIPHSLNRGNNDREKTDSLSLVDSKRGRLSVSCLLDRNGSQVPWQRAYDNQFFVVIVKEVNPQQVLHIVSDTEMIILQQLNDAGWLGHYDFLLFVPPIPFLHFTFEKQGAFYRYFYGMRFS